MKHRRNWQLKHLFTQRPYQLVAVSAAALLVASSTGALLTRPDSATAGRETPSTVAELSRPDERPASRDRGRDRPVDPTPSSTGSAPATDARTASPSASADVPTARPTRVKPPSAKTLDFEYQAQINYYYCGPGATRIALTALDIRRGQDDIAARLGTTVNGTNSAEDTTRVMNDLVGRDLYRTRSIPGGAATPAEMDRLQADVVRAIVAGRAVVANIAGSAVDVAGAGHSYPGGHYLTVVGYRDDGRTVRLADPANPSVSSYWMSTINLANWIAQKGYSA